MLIYGVIAGAVLLYFCASKLFEIASYMKDVRSSASQIQLETEGLIQRLATIEDAIKEISDDARKLAAVADSYDDEVLRQVRRSRADAELFDGT